MNMIEKSWGGTCFLQNFFYKDPSEKSTLPGSIVKKGKKKLNRKSTKLELVFISEVIKIFVETKS